MTFTNSYFLRLTINFPLVIRILLVVLYIFPAAFLMGIPFPTAIRTLGENLSGEVPWIWGINGASAVLGSVLSVILSMVIGIKFTLLFGVLLYLCIAYISNKLSKQNT
ncbi:MAG: hypothetical protein HY934_02905 [Candidatus Firestonebacteria bacterium]|nr:hypothetical protein [Candidatus Firestonebacteria bacterium]